ncbi:MAG: tetratricopeptide repeat protein [Pseudomonadales bacterium]|nr:tetratricopeptide repeat protein [Pseudomonadales bacterium]MDG1441147.1 tetratricopeptide repeat protein [Pseudomonadales bacterium]
MSTRAAVCFIDYTQVIALQPNDAWAYYNRALIHQKLGKDPLAQKDFSRNIEIDPGYLRARASRSYSFIAPLIPILLVFALG